MTGDAGGILDSRESILYAQVKSGDPEMKIDADERLRHANFPSAQGSLFLGDVADALLRGFGAHEPPRVVEIPGFDQQRWKIECSDAELSITIESKAYWGFGLFASCFLNTIRMEGSLQRRARLIFDLVSGLGRNPWEATRKKRFAKVTGNSNSDHKAAWENLIERGREDLSNTIQNMQSKAIALEEMLPQLAEKAPPGWSIELAQSKITQLRDECDAANDALHDKTAAGVERALARAEKFLIEADPRTEVSGQHESGDDLLESMTELEEDDIDLSEKILLHEELPTEIRRTHEALDDDNIPFVDLSEEE